MRCLAALVGLVGCNSLLGVHDFGTSDGGDGPIGDGGSTMRVSGRYQPASLQGDQLGQPTLVALIPIPDALEARFADGSRIPVTPDPSTGAFAFDAPTNTPYSLIVSAPQTPVHEYYADATELVLSEVIPYRVGGVPVPIGTKLQYNVTVPGSFEGGLYVTGAWTSVATFLSMPSFDWSTVHNTGATPFLASATSGDRIYLAQVTNVQGVAAISAVREDTLELAGGATTTIDPAPLMSLPLYCASVNTTAGTEQQRLHAAYPALGSGGAVIGVDAVPDPLDAAQGVLFTVASKGIADNLPLDVSFATPFAGFRPVLLRYASVASTSVTASTSYYTPLPLTPPCGTPNDPPPAIALPGPAMLGGISLAGAAIVAPQGHAPIDLAWDLASPGAVDTWGVVLADLTSGASRQYASSVRHVAIEPALLVGGHSYRVDVVAVYGRPHAAKGDFATSTYPQGLAVHEDKFSVASP